MCTAYAILACFIISQSKSRILFYYKFLFKKSQHVKTPNSCACVCVCLCGGRRRETIERYLPFNFIKQHCLIPLLFFFSISITAI
ncbi:MAG: hypothetical protein EXX96DRAFT_584620 [Benjaminiella poitrasii]|nr:MAG: hypothetical protein EXX96DRAFT_584620 [Benjaminiella poitrasii]